MLGLQKSTWTKLEPGHANNLHFMLPNVITEEGGERFFSEIAEKLYFLSTIASDGRVIRHGTFATYFGLGTGTFDGSKRT